MLPKVWKYIESHTDKRSTMSAISKIWPRNSDDYSRIELAYKDAFEGHRDQWRHSGERYMRHILGVVSIILYLFDNKKIPPDPDLIIAAFLHDLVEDHPDKWTINKIREKYGPKVARIVWAVTKPSKRSYKNQKDKYEKATIMKVIKGGHFSIVLKLADRLHNMLTLWGSPKKKHDKVNETIQFHMRMSQKEGILVYELVLATAEQISSIHIDDDQLSEVGHYLKL